MSGTPSYEELAAENAELKRVVAELSDRICELERRVSADSSNSSRPPSSDAPWDKKPAKKRSSRITSGRQPGKQPGAPSASRSLSTPPASIHAALEARERGADKLDEATLTQIRSHYHGALARGDDDNQEQHTTLADKARTLISRFRRFEDMILRFATDLSVAFTNNAAERAVRPVKVQQRTSGGCWRTLQGLTDFAIVQSYLDTATKWGRCQPVEAIELARRSAKTSAGVR